MIRRARVVVSGRVQGVFYRATCAHRARQLALAGWVRNRPDGRVEAAFEGNDRDVAAMIEWCRRGPDLARVDAIEIQELEPVGDRGFRVA